MRLSSSASCTPYKFCEDSSALDTFATSDADQPLQLPETTATIDSKVSNSSSSLLKMPLALLIKLTNYFSVLDFCNYTLVNRRLVPIVGRIEFIKMQNSTDLRYKEFKFAMAHTLPKQLEISLVMAFDAFYSNLLTMTTLESLTLLNNDSQTMDTSTARDSLLKRICNFDIVNGEKQQSKFQSRLLPSFPKLRSLTLKECLGDIKLFNLFNPGSLTHLAIEDDSDVCDDGKCPFHHQYQLKDGLQRTQRTQSRAEHCDWLSQLSGLQSLSLMSTMTDADWRYPSLLHFPSLTKLQLHVESHLPHRFTHLEDLDQLPELQHLSLEFVAQGLPVPILPGTCNCLDVLVRMKKLRTLDFDLNLGDEGEEMDGEVHYIPILQLIMGKIRAAIQLTSLGLAANVPLLRKGIQFLVTPASISTDAKVSTTIVSLANNLRELRLNSNVGVLTSHQKEVFDVLEKFTALTSLKISNLSSPPDNFNSVRELRELDFTGSRSSFTTNPGKTQLDWMRMFPNTLQKITMPTMKSMDTPLVKKYIEVIGSMPLIREIVLPPTFLVAFKSSLRHIFVNELRKLRPEIEFS